MFRKLFLSLALFVFTLTACEFQEPVASIPVPAAVEGGPCSQEIRSVDLHYSYLPPASYAVTLETGPFYVENCMCRLLSYQLYVTKTGGQQWALTLENGQTVPFTPIETPTEDVLTIDDLAPIFDIIGNPGSGVLTARIIAKKPLANPVLNRAGGLCVVENYDGGGVVFGGGPAGPPIGSQANGPVVQLITGPVPGSYIVKVYIPVGITNPI